MGFSKPQLHGKFAEMLKEKLQIFRSLPSPWPNSLFIPVTLDDGPWQTAAVRQISSRWLHLLRKYKGICFQTTNSLSDPPVGEVMGNVRTLSIDRCKARSRLPIRNN